MAKGIVEQVTCEKCDAAVRENTVFCYNCGNRVAEDVAPNIVSNGSEADVDVRTKAALDDIVERFRTDDIEENKLALAAAERKKARSKQRRVREFVWVPKDDSSSGLVILVAVLIALVTGVVVFLTVLWK